MGLEPSMYHPFFRGKQYELITLRETAELLNATNFVPIIEPVKQSLKALEKTLTELDNAEVQTIVVVNPFHGDHSEDSESIPQLLADTFPESKYITAGILLREDTTLEQAVEYCDQHNKRQIALIHSGFSNGKQLAIALGKRVDDMKNVFVDGRSSKLYQRHFAGAERVLLRDGFKPRRNKDHPPVEFFSDLHVTYEDEGMNGFGDFLIVGDDFREGGGPAYAVAIHITFIDGQNDDEMNIYHFKSIRQDTPTDPAGKFGEALAKLIEALDEKDCQIFESEAIGEFRSLHARGHYPGLGYVKKLSMKHHIETLANYIEKRA